MSEETPLGSSLVIAGLQAVLKLPIDDRLIAAKKAIVSVELSKLKLTHALAEEIRRIVKSVLKSKTATQEQQDAAEDLKARLFSRSPRRKKNQKPERILDDVVPTENPGSISDDASSAFGRDSWTTDDFEEYIRLCRIDREGGDFKSKIRAALEDRAESLENLVALLTFVRKRSIRGPLFSQLDQMLIERGAVEVEPNRCSVALESFEEMMSDGYVRKD